MRFEDFPRMEPLKSLTFGDYKYLLLAVLVTIATGLSVPFLVFQGVEMSTGAWIATVVGLLFFSGMLMTKGLRDCFRSGLRPAKNYMEQLSELNREDLLFGYRCRHELTEPEASMIRKVLNQRFPGWSEDVVPDRQKNPREQIA